MGGTNRESSRLGNDGGVSSNTCRNQGPHSEAFVFLVYDGSDENLSCRIRRRALHYSGANTCEPGLHVRRTATIDAVVTDRGVERWVHHSVDTDHVEMTVED